MKPINNTVHQIINEIFSKLSEIAVLSRVDISKIFYHKALNFQSVTLSIK
jgi:hypothetical protein